MHESGRELKLEEGVSGSGFALSYFFESSR